MDRTSAPTVSPISTLTSEEIDALLSGELPDGDAVLLLAARPDQAGAVTEFLSARGVPVTVCAAPFRALDLLRQRPYSAFVAALSDLPPNPAWYVDRLRQIDPNIPLCFLQEGSQPLPSEQALVLDWPLEEDGLEGLLRLAARRSAHAHGASGAPDAPPPRVAALLTDPLFAVQTVLQALVEGETFREGLQRWANRDPAIRGTVAVDESPDSLQLDAKAADREERQHMLRLLFKALGETDRRTAAGPAAAGPFSIIPTSDGPSPYLALWLLDQGEGGEALARLHPVLDLLRRLPEPRALGTTDGKSRFVALLASRMRAAQRRGGRLGILALDPGATDALLRLFDALRKTLRGEDWVEVVGPRIYAILEEADQEKCRALLGRLRGSAPVQGLKIVALGWQPGEDSAEELMERAEGILVAGDGDRSLTGS